MYVYIHIYAHICVISAICAIYMCVCGYDIATKEAISDNKQSACNGGVSGLLSGSGRSPREGNGYPLQCSCLEYSIYIYSMYIYTNTYVISQQPKNNQSDNWRKRKL